MVNLGSFFGEALYLCGGSKKHAIRIENIKDRMWKDEEREAATDYQDRPS
jgi:hypothetical protein